MDGSSWDGTLSMNEFSVSAQAFAKKWRRHNSASPPWLWIDCGKRQPFVSSHQIEGYLSLEHICLNGSSKEICDQACESGEEETGTSEKEETVDHATLVQSSNHEVHYYDFHIAYSASFRVPVLYFRAYLGDGQPLALNEIEEDLPACSTKALAETKWTFITQEEHPYLNRPWYKLHPCATGEWMKLLFLSLAQSGTAAVLQYLVSWFSVVGQVVGIRVPIEMVNNQCS